jgi:hypothetical protein
MMVEKGRIRRKLPAGNYFETPVRYGQLNQNQKWFGRADKFGRAEQQSLTRLQYEARNFGTAVVRFWDDDRKNRSQAQLVDYVEEKVNNTKDSMVAQLETDTFVQNADPKAMNALATLVSVSPLTGTVGGISRATNSWMANQACNATGKSLDTDLLNIMTTMFNTCSKYKAGTQRSPDIIVTTQTVYEKYEELCRAMQMISTSSTIQASLGFGNLMFKNVPIFFADDCPAGYMYMLNTEHLALQIDPAADFVMTEWKSDPDTLDRVAQIVVVCQFTADNFAKQGVIYNLGS